MDSLLFQTTQIVSSYITQNVVMTDGLSALIREVYRVLASFDGAPSAAEPLTKAAVEVRKSVFNDHIVCLDCGQSFKMLKRHVLSDHQMTPQQYREKWDLPATYPMTAPGYAEIRSKLAKQSGLGRRVEQEPQKGKKRK